MRTKLATFLVLAGGVAGCASNPPPPPPMAMAPEPAPMMAPAARPAARGANDGMYRGTVEAAADNAPTCRTMAPAATARVRGRSVTMGGMRATLNGEGALTGGGRRGPKVTGTLANGTIDANSMVGRCSYHYVLNKA